MAKKITTIIPKEEIEKQYHFMQSVQSENERIAASKGKRNAKAFVRTFGCQMNEHDSEKISGMLTSMGYEITDCQEACDIIVFNTCCVRENAEEKVFGHLGALKGLKRANPDLIIVVCGCMTEQPHIVDEIRKKYKNVDLVFGTHNLHRFPELIYNVMTSRVRTYETSRTDSEVAEGMPVKRDSNIKAWVTIMYGCDNYCSYCIVPYVRGHERSRRPEDILKEIKELQSQGIKEVTLLGQNVNSYGKDLEPAATFAGLLDLICEETDIPRIRFMTSHPKDISPELIDTMANHPAICDQLHLPVQSGSTRLLEKMNRRYTKERYLDIINNVKKKIPGISLTTDIIVGFPGETEEDFAETLDLVEKVGYDNAFTFIYSKRTGTPAASYPDQVPDDVVKERFDRLLALQNGISRRINDTYEGKIVEVLTEGLSKNNTDRYTGRTGGGKIVNFTAPYDVTGKIVNVKITHIQTWSLEGELIEDEK